MITFPNEPSGQLAAPARPSAAAVGKRGAETLRTAAPGAGTDGRAESDRSLVWLFAACIAVRLPFLFSVPMREAPDEFAHFWVIDFLRQHWRLPHAKEVFEGGASAVYGSLPQMGYLPHVLAAMIGPADNAALFARFGSLLMGLVMVVAAYKIGRILFSDRFVALALPIAVICHPQLAFIHSYANNDSTAAALSSLIIWLMLETTRSGITPGRSVALGALIGWTALSKFSALAVIPVVGLSFMAAAWIHGTSVFSTIVSLAVIGVVAATLSGWWFVRNFFEFQGDVLGTRTMYHTWAMLFQRDLNYYLPASHIIKNFSWWRMLFFSFWGMFGYMSRMLWRPVYIAYACFFFAALGGCAASVARSLLQKGMDRLRVSMWAALVAIVLINVASVVWASTVNLGGPQGRYLFTSELPLMALIIGGLSAFGSPGRKLLLAFLIFNALVLLGSWIYLFGLYGWNIRPV